MPWVEFTADHVRSVCAARELEVYEETATAEFEEGEATTPTPRLPQIVAMVADRIRGAVRSNPKVIAMGAAGTIPDFAVFHASVLARNAMLGLSPVPEGMTDPRRDEQRAAEKFVESLSTMNPSAFADDPPTTSDDADVPAYGGNALLDF